MTSRLIDKIERVKLTRPFMLSDLPRNFYFKRTTTDMREKIEHTNENFEDRRAEL